MKMSRFLRDPRFAALIQFVKFGIVGLSNTAISYGIDMFCYYVLFANASWAESTKILITAVLAFTISVTNSYYWNNRYVFGSGERKTVLQHLAAYLRTVMCYGLTGLLLGPAIKLWLNGRGMAYWLSSIACLVVTIPLNFLMNKFWAFRGSRKQENSGAGKVGGAKDEY